MNVNYCERCKSVCFEFRSEVERDSHAKHEGYEAGARDARASIVNALMSQSEHPYLTSQEARIMKGISEVIASKGDGGPLAVRM